MCTSIEKRSNGIKVIMQRFSLFCVLTICAATLYSCSTPSLDGSWYTSIPISENGIEGKADILLDVASGKKKTEGQFIGTIPFSLTFEAEPGFYDIASNIDITGTWRIKNKRTLYVSFNSFTLDVKPEKVNFTPDVTNPDSIANAYYGDILGTFVGMLLGATLPIEKMITDTKAYVAKMLEDEVNSIFSELVGSEDVFGCIDISDNSFVISEYAVKEQSENDSILTFYKKELK